MNKGKTTVENSKGQLKFEFNSRPKNSHYLRDNNNVINLKEHSKKILTAQILKTTKSF